FAKRKPTGQERRRQRAMSRLIVRGARNHPPRRRGPQPRNECRIFAVVTRSSKRIAAPFARRFGVLGLPLLFVLLSGVSALAASTPRPYEILAFGDSLTAGLGLPSEAAFPARLEAWLRERGVPAHVVNAGLSGETTAMGRVRLDATLTSKPDLVILELGA